MEGESISDSRLSTAEESVQMIKNELVPCLENSMDKLQKVWNEIGISEEQKEERTQVVLEHLQNLLKEMVNEEEELKTTLLGNVAMCTEELIKISGELGLPCYVPEEVSLLKKENELRTKVNELKLEKHERLKSLKIIRTKEKQLCDRLCLPPHNIYDREVPSNEDLRELEANIEYLQNEMSKRLENFKKIRHAVCRLWEELEMEPGAEIERQMIKDNAEESFKLSSDNLAILKALQNELEMQHKDNIQTASSLREQAKSLWVKLDVDEAERTSFLARHVGFKKSVIAAFREEIERLHALKIQHIQKFIEGLRKELHTLWDKCYFGAAQRSEFTPIFSENYTEELLTTHEHQVEAVRNYYEENKALYKLVEKRENMFKKMEEFENKAHDVSRFANRGGQLLKEEKMRKALRKELPKTEKELKLLIEIWERDNERHFFVNGNKYIDIVNNQWNSFKAHKEQEKQDRHKRQKEIMKEEMVYGSKPTTPVKRRFIGTPSKTPTKLRKLDNTQTPTKFMHPSVCPSPVRPTAANRPPRPTGAVAKKVQRTKTAKTPKRISARLQARRQVLRENNSNNISKYSSGSNSSVSSGGSKTPSSKCSPVTSSATSSNKDFSLVSPMSYDDFAVGLEDNENCRSSMMGSRVASIISV